MMTTWKRIQKCATERKRVNQKVFNMVPRVQNPGIKRERNFFPTCFPGGIVKRAETKEGENVLELSSKKEVAWACV